MWSHIVVGAENTCGWWEREYAVRVRSTFVNWGTS